ncbi:MAG: hypothetical protein IPN44_07075 [Flavobacteriales bacterium]|nr:hypothetical protein [Flavobacteriales bacterium]
MSTLAVDQEQHDRRTGVIFTIVFHILLLILFLYIGLQQPDPLPQEEGIELAFEDAGGLTGGGSPAQAQTTPPPPVEAVTPETPEPVATQEESDVAVPKPTTPKPKPQPKPPEPRKPDPRALFNPTTGGAPGNSPSTTAGNGPPSSTPGDGGSGSFKGKAFEGRLAGRGLMRGPNITEKPSEGGKVALDIFVDRTGKVTHVGFNLDRSTTTSQVLFNLAKKAALQCTFSPKPDGPAEQKGDMTFIFILE